MPQLAFTLQIGWQLPDAGNRLETQGQGQEGGWGLAQKAICACASYVWSMSADHQCFLLKRKGGGLCRVRPCLSSQHSLMDQPHPNVCHGESLDPKTQKVS